MALWPDVNKEPDSRDLMHSDAGIAGPQNSCVIVYWHTKDHS